MRYRPSAEMPRMAERRYEWDEAKRIENLVRHGVDFRAATGFDWESAVIFDDRRRNYGEARFLAYGALAGRLHVLVHTLRSERTRVISLRKANRRERAAYTKGAGPA